MPVIHSSVWGHTTRPWGYEVRVDFTDDKGAIHNETLSFKTQPSDAEVTAAVSDLRAAIETRLNMVEPPFVDPVEQAVSQIHAEYEGKLQTLTMERDALVVEKATITVELDALKAIPVVKGKEIL